MEETRGHDMVTGTREEIVSELTDRLNYWHRMGASDRKAERYADAIACVESGSFSVKVGNTIYNVVASEDVPEQRMTRDETADNPLS